MGLFNGRKEENEFRSQREILQGKYASACYNVLLVVIFTLINVVLLVLNSDTYFLFSAYIPYALADLGMFFCGMYPVEYYAGELVGMNFLPKGVFVAILVVIAIILVMYLIAWIFARKGKSGWLIAVLVMFGLDTAVLLLLNGISVDFIVDYIFHVWVIYSVITGLRIASKLKKLPDEEIEDTISTEITG